MDDEKDSPHRNARFSPSFYLKRKRRGGKKEKKKREGRSHGAQLKDLHVHFLVRTKRKRGEMGNRGRQDPSERTTAGPLSSSINLLAKVLVPPSEKVPPPRRLYWPHEREKKGKKKKKKKEKLAQPKITVGEELGESRRFLFICRSRRMGRPEERGEKGKKKGRCCSQNAQERSRPVYAQSP